MLADVVALIGGHSKGIVCYNKIYYTCFFLLLYAGTQDIVFGEVDR